MPVLLSGAAQPASDVFPLGIYEVPSASGANDSARIAAVIARIPAAGGILWLAAGQTYQLGSEVLGKSNLQIWANGATIATYGATRMRSYFAFVGCTNYKVVGGNFDLGVTTLPLYTAADYAAAVYPGSCYNVGIFNFLSSNSEFRDCVLTNLYTAGITFIQHSGYAKLTNNFHSSPVQAQTLNTQHVMFTTCASRNTIQRCWFWNDAPASADVGVNAIFASGLTGALSVRGSWFNYCGRNNAGAHNLGTFAIYGDVVNFDCKNNWMFNNLYQPLRLSCCSNGEVCGNYISMASVADPVMQMVSLEGTLGFLGVGVIGISDLNIHHNAFVDAFQGVDRVCCQVLSSDWSIPSRNIRFEDNTLVNMGKMVVALGPWDGLFVRGNNVHGAYPAVTLTQQNPGITAINGVTEVQSSFKNLDISGNRYFLTATHGGNVAFVDFTKAPAYTGTIGDWRVSDNRQFQPALGAGVAVVGRGVAGAPVGRAEVRDNAFGLFAAAFDIANFAELDLRDNRAVSCTTFRLNVGSNTTEVTTGNRRSAGAMQGRAVLVGGTILVNTAEVSAADNIQLTRVVAGGVAGHLSVGAIVPGVSLVVNSSSGTDTSTVYWEIRH
jgi:hypothetical protein